MSGAKSQFRADDAVAPSRPFREHNSKGGGSIYTSAHGAGPFWSPRGAHVEVSCMGGGMPRYVWLVSPFMLHGPW
ncbi:hypothetical protein CY34DRAFT_799061 [Suillus luteus UH-Slu-Lm8-n1]|uniref:Unplaced genomic scaffold CY34scaffold_13, whole genome shotgun sequence n=1 Tax=Suillus luteus UH-Slu-Lm8-n1 TaxID=930992 RepID=A0A0D0B1B2_9AGAM|nr:hypothetical protein CY34DRAFT_799061 [Suillus luteus UH-Slu-Lm8-n1]